MSDSLVCLDRGGWHCADLRAGVESGCPVITEESSAAIRAALDVAVYGGAVCAVESSGTVRCWGESERPLFGRDGLSMVCNPFPGAAIATAGAMRVSVNGTIGCAWGVGNVQCWGISDDDQPFTGHDRLVSISASEETQDVTMSSTQVFVLSRDGRVRLVDVTHDYELPIEGRGPLGIDAGESGVVCGVSASRALWCEGPDLAGEVGRPHVTRTRVYADLFSGD